MSEENSVSVSEIRNQWAEYPEPLDFDKLCKVSRHILEQVCEVEVIREEDEDVLYLGPELDKKIASVSPQPSQALSAENINYEKEDQGRDELSQVLQIIIQLGVEQGLRIAEQWRASKGIESSIKRAISIIESDGDNNKVAVTILESALELLNTEQNVDFENLEQEEKDG